MDDDKDESPSGIIEEARERFQRAEKHMASNRLIAIDDLRFYMADSENGWQWPDEIRKQRQFDKRVCLTVNLTAQHVNQVVNQIRQAKPSCRVMAVDDYADKKTAEILAGLIRNIQAASNADDAHDIAAEHAVVSGEGYWRVLTEYESPQSFDQVIKIKPILNPQLVYIDPDCREMDKSDAEWGFIFEDIGKEQFKREHPDIDPSSWQPNRTNWVKEDTFRRAEYFYCEWVDDKALLLADGSTALESKLPDGVKRDGMTLVHESGDSIQIVKERETTRKQWKWCILVGGHDEPLDTRDWVGDYLPIVSSVGKEINVNGEVVRKGLVRDLKDPARMVNFSYSETVQTLALQNKIPYMAASEAIEGFESIWGAANLENRAYLPFNARDQEGNPLPVPQRQQPAVMPAAQVQLLQLSTEEMRGASGQQNANFGIKSEASSGVGIQRLKAQGEVATYHFMDNHARALRYEAKILIDLIQKIYDTKRVVRVLGLDGKPQTATLDPNHPQPYSEVDIGEEDIQKIFNPSVGQYDVVIDTGPSFQTQRQEAFAALTELAGRSPQLMQVAGDIIMRAADFPMSQELAKRLEKTLPPNLQDQKGGAEAQLQQAQQQGQQMQMQLQQLTQQLQEAQGKLQQAESGQAKVQMEAQLKMQLAQIDVQVQQAKTQAEMEAKREQAMMDADFARERAELEAHLTMEKAKQDAELKMQIAKMEVESKEEIAELQAYVEMKKAGRDNPALTADVNNDLAEPEEVKPKKRSRKKVTMIAPSGGTYTGMIEDSEDEDGNV
jgi:hypothetical protein